MENTNSLDFLENTKDPLQKRRRISKNELFAWRLALLHRFPCYENQGFIVTVENIDYYDEIISNNRHDETLCPHNLAKTVIRLGKFDAHQHVLHITITLYIKKPDDDEGTILVQGSSCPDFGVDEFNRLQSAVRSYLPITAENLTLLYEAVRNIPLSNILQLESDTEVSFDQLVQHNTHQSNEETQPSRSTIQDKRSNETSETNVKTSETEVKTPAAIQHTSSDYSSFEKARISEASKSTDIRITEEAVTDVKKKTDSAIEEDTSSFTGQVLSDKETQTTAHIDIATEMDLMESKLYEDLSHSFTQNLNHEISLLKVQVFNELKANSIESENLDLKSDISKLKNDHQKFVCQIGDCKKHFQMYDRQMQEFKKENQVLKDSLKSQASIIADLQTTISKLVNKQNINTTTYSEALQTKPSSFLPNQITPNSQTYHNQVKHTVDNETPFYNVTVKNGFDILGNLGNENDVGVDSARTESNNAMQKPHMHCLSVNSNPIPVIVSQNLGKECKTNEIKDTQILSTTYHTDHHNIPSLVSEMPSITSNTPQMQNREVYYGQDTQHSMSSGTPQMPNSDVYYGHHTQHSMSSGTPQRPNRNVFDGQQTQCSMSSGTLQRPNRDVFDGQQTQCRMSSGTPQMPNRDTCNGQMPYYGNPDISHDLSNFGNDIYKTPFQVLQTKTIDDNTDYLIIGDSCLSKLNPSKMNTGHYFHVQKINVSGMTTTDIFNWLQNHHPHQKIQKLVVHVGVNDACHSVINQQNWSVLIHCLKCTFPNASITMSSIIPTKTQQQINVNITKSNTNLKQVCLSIQTVAFVDHTYSFRTEANAPKQVMYENQKHPSLRGVVIMARNIKWPGIDFKKMYHSQKNEGNRFQNQQMLNDAFSNAQHHGIPTGASMCKPGLETNSITDGIQPQLQNSNHPIMQEKSQELQDEAEKFKTDLLKKITSALQDIFVKT